MVSTWQLGWSEGRKVKLYGDHDAAVSHILPSSVSLYLVGSGTAGASETPKKERVCVLWLPSLQTVSWDAGLVLNP